MGLLTSAGPDGIAVPGVAWTNQSTQYNSNKTLESGGPAAASILNPALRNSYQTWSFDPALSNAAVSAASPTIATLVFVPETFTCSTVDLLPSSVAGNLTVAIWPSNAPAGVATPLVWSAATAASLGSVNPLTFNGTNSPTSVTLVGGTSYFVTVISSAATLVNVYTANSAAIANAAPTGTFSITTTYRVGTVGTLTGS